MKTHVLTSMLVAAVAAGCSQPVISASTALSGSSQTLEVSGSYAPAAIDRVDRLTIDGGKLVLHGSASTLAVDIPPTANPEQPDSHWALVTESDTGRGRVLTFTHDMSLDDFTIELPSSEAPIRYGGFSGRDGNDVMVLAWGEGSRSYYAQLTIVRKAKG
jgi:hypothetical protein